MIEARGRVGFNGGRLRLDLTESVEKTTSPFGITVLATRHRAGADCVTIAGGLEREHRDARRAAGLGPQRQPIVSGTFPTTPQSLDAFVTVTDGTGELLAEDRSRYRHRRLRARRRPSTPSASCSRTTTCGRSTPATTSRRAARVDLGATAPPPPPLLTIAEARVDAVNNADGNPPRDFDSRSAGPGRDGARHRHLDRFPRRHRHRVLHPGRHRRHRSLQHRRSAPAFNIGDTVEAIGTVTQFNGLTELTVTVGVVPRRRQRRRRRSSSRCRSSPTASAKRSRDG